MAEEAQVRARGPIGVVSIPPLLSITALFSCAQLPPPEVEYGSRNGETGIAWGTSDGEVTNCRAPPLIEWVSEPGMPELKDGDPFTMVRGPQGGWHIALDAGIRGAMTLRFELYATLASTSEQLAGNTFTIPLREWDAVTCTGRMEGMIAYLDDLPRIDPRDMTTLVGEALDVRLVATDLDTGHAGEAQVRVIASVNP